MSPAPEGTCSVTRGAFRTYRPYPSPGQAKGIKLLKTQPHAFPGMARLLTYPSICIDSNKVV